MQKTSTAAALACALTALAAVAATAGEETVPDIEIRNAKAPSPGVLTGGQPTAEQLEQAARAGYRTIVNLRGTGEDAGYDEPAKVAELGLAYVAIPMAGADGLTEANARQLAGIVDDADQRPVMVHCASGNRVGALLALKAFHVDGKSAEDALEIGLAAGLTRLEPAVRERLEKP